MPCRSVTARDGGRTSLRSARLELRALTRFDWLAIRVRIRFERAAGRCECEGECGSGHDKRCSARHGRPHPRTNSIVVLTVAPAEPYARGQPATKTFAPCCQACHLAYGGTHHAETRRRRHNDATYSEEEPNR